MVMDRGKGMAMFTIFRGDMALVTCTVATRRKAADVAWRNAEKGYFEMTDKLAQFLPEGHAPEQPASTPWVAVLLWPGLAWARPDVLTLLGDIERCLVWTIVEDEQTRQ